MSTSNDNNNQEQPHEGSLGTDRNPPSGTENATKPSTEEERMKKRIEELRKRDPFIYR